MVGSGGWISFFVVTYLSFHQSLAQTHFRRFCEKRVQCLLFERFMSKPLKCHRFPCPIEDDKLLRRFSNGDITSLEGYNPLKTFRLTELVQRPFLVPPNAEEREICRQCSEKRNKCFQYTIATFGICLAADIIGGPMGELGCTVVTAPRTLDCYYNSFQHCYRQNCGYLSLF